VKVSVGFVGSGIHVISGNKFKAANSDIFIPELSGWLSLLRIQRFHPKAARAIERRAKSSLMWRVSEATRTIKSAMFPELHFVTG
jgi:hypothetical protein